jgi:transcriptional regulator GlxA family with amidase domain
MKIALVVYPGVTNDECDAFRSVLSLMRETELVRVGAEIGPCHGPGGTQQVDVVYGDLSDPDMVIVPGGLGAERIAESAELLEWLARVGEVADHVVASSTGTVVLASAGLLHGQPAATHWLATDLLRRYGSEQDGRRLVVRGNVVTCEGSLSAVDAAFSLVREIEGPGAVVRIRETLIERGEPHFRPPAWWERFVDRRARPGVSSSPRSAPEPLAPGGGPVTPMSVIVELVPVEEIHRKRQRRARHHR